MKTREIYLSGLNAWLDAHGTEPMNGDPEWLAHEAGLVAVVADTRNDAMVDAAAWARSCSGESADMAADYIQEMSTQ